MFLLYYVNNKTKFIKGFNMAYSSTHTSNTSPELSKWYKNQAYIKLSALGDNDDFELALQELIIEIKASEVMRTLESIDSANEYFEAIEKKLEEIHLEQMEIIHDRMIEFGIEGKKIYLTSLKTEPTSKTFIESLKADYKGLELKPEEEALLEEWQKSVRIKSLIQEMEKDPGMKDFLNVDKDKLVQGYNTRIDEQLNLVADLENRGVSGRELEEAVRKQQDLEKQRDQVKSGVLDHFKQTLLEKANNNIKDAQDIISKAKSPEKAESFLIKREARKPDQAASKIASVWSAWKARKQLLKSAKVTEETVVPGQSEAAPGQSKAEQAEAAPGQAEALKAEIAKVAEELVTETLEAAAKSAEAATKAAEAAAAAKRTEAIDAATEAEAAATEAEAAATKAADLAAELAAKSANNLVRAPLKQVISTLDAHGPIMPGMPG